MHRATDGGAHTPVETKGSAGSRREILKRAGGAGLVAALGAPLRAAAWAAGTDRPERSEVRIGFMPLTDCASVVMAAAKGFDRRHGVRIVPTLEASWASVRDKLVRGELDAAQALYGLVYGVELGIGGPQRAMAVLMTLNQNGQAITLSRHLREREVADGPALARAVAAAPRGLRLAQTFPTGTHAMWLYYWLAAHGIDPLEDVRTMTVPPPQMVANLAEGRIDGCCVGEPWNARAAVGGVGFTAATSQDIWPDHPEKVLGTTAEWVERHPNTARAITAAILEAARWIDASDDNRRATARTIAQRPYINVAPELVTGRMLGAYESGDGRRWQDRHPMRFFGDGTVGYPYLSDGMWFLTQHKRWGLLQQHPDYEAVARAVQRSDVYADAAEAVKAPLPVSPYRRARLIDGVVWDGSDPARYADGFAVRAGAVAL